MDSAFWPLLIKCSTNLTKKFSSFREAKGIVEACKERGGYMPVCIENAYAIDSDCPACVKNLANTVHSLEACENIDQSKFKKEAELCEKDALSDIGYFFKRGQNPIINPLGGLGGFGGFGSFGSFGSFGPGGFGGSGMLGSACSPDKGDGRVTCNEKVYILDTSIKLGERRNFGKELEKSEEKYNKSTSGSRAK